MTGGNDSVSSWLADDTTLKVQANLMPIIMIVNPTSVWSLGNKKPLILYKNKIYNLHSLLP
jgi:hypothetical protein